MHFNRDCCSCLCRVLDGCKIFLFPTWSQTKRLVRMRRGGIPLCCSPSANRPASNLCCSCTKPAPRWYGGAARPWVSTAYMEGAACRNPGHNLGKCRLQASNETSPSSQHHLSPLTVCNPASAGLEIITGQGWTESEAGFLLQVTQEGKASLKHDVFPLFLGALQGCHLPILGHPGVIELYFCFASWHLLLVRPVSPSHHSRPSAFVPPTHAGL